MGHRQAGPLSHYWHAWRRREEERNRKIFKGIMTYLSSMGKKTESLVQKAQRKPNKVNPGTHNKIYYNEIVQSQRQKESDIVCKLVPSKYCVKIWSPTLEVGPVWVMVVDLSWIAFCPLFTNEWVHTVLHERWLFKTVWHPSLLFLPL